MNGFAHSYAMLKVHRLYFILYGNLIFSIINSDFLKVIVSLLGIIYFVYFGLKSHSLCNKLKQVHLHIFQKSCQSRKRKTLLRIEIKRHLGSKNNYKS